LVNTNENILSMYTKRIAMEKKSKNKKI